MIKKNRSNTFNAQTPQCAVSVVRTFGQAQNKTVAFFTVLLFLFKLKSIQNQTKSNEELNDNNKNVDFFDSIMSIQKQKIKY